MPHHRQLGFLALICSLSCLLAISPDSIAFPKVNTTLPSASVAESDDALASYLNPAALGHRDVFNLHYLRTYDGPSEQDDALFLAGWGSAFSMEFSEAGGTPFNRYTLSDGFRLADHTFLGSSYSWYTSDDPSYDDLSLWQIGWLHRRTYLSFGGVIRNLNRPTLHGARLPRQYDFGIALRPGTERLTLSMDFRKQEEVEGWDFSWGMELRPVRSLFVRSRLHEDKSFDVHFGWNLAELGMSGYNTFDDNRDHQDGVAQLSYAAQPYTKRPRRRLLLELTPSQIAPVLTRAKKDKDVAGALLKLDRSQLGLGRLQEARDAMVEFRASGKVLTSYARTYTTGTYLLASACDQILTHPSGQVRLIGLRAEALFAKEMLDKVGVQANIERIGDYKSAAEQLTRDDMSDAFREAENTLLDDLYDQLVTQIVEGGSWSVDEVRSLVDGGPYSAVAAKEKGLIHRFAYDDQAETFAGELVSSRHTTAEASAYVKERLYPRSWRGPRPRVALIYARGMMNTGKSFRDFITGTRVMGSDTIAQAIQTARKDPKVKAVVLRIDSVGGLVLASDILWHELMLTRDEKPLIVSMADVAASGGYYIAMPAHRILAEPATITGSIGVISGKYSLRGLYDKLGVHKTILKRGAHADFYSDYGYYPPEEQQIVQTQVQQIYQDFVQKVADAREKTFEHVDAVAQGRVWTGRQALEHGLVDELGGLPRAIEIAKQEAGLSEDTRVELMVLPQESWLDQLVGRLAMNLTPQTLLSPGHLARMDDQIWAIAPYGTATK